MEQETALLCSIDLNDVNALVGGSFIFPGGALVVQVERLYLESVFRTVGVVLIAPGKLPLVVFQGVQFEVGRNGEVGACRGGTGTCGCHLDHAGRLGFAAVILGNNAVVLAGLVLAFEVVHRYGLFGFVHILPARNRIRHVEDLDNETVFRTAVVVGVAPDKYPFVVSALDNVQVGGGGERVFQGVARDVSTSRGRRCIF